jgi:hypothetical protein
MADRRIALVVVALAGCRGWSGTLLIDTRDPMDTGNGYQGPRVAVGAEAGTPAGLWDMGPFGEQLRAARSTPPPPPVILASDVSGSTRDHAVAVAGDNSAMAVFARSGQLVWSRNDGALWTGAADLAPGYLPVVAADGAGNFLAVWSSSLQVQAARFSAATATWGPAETIGPSSVETQAIDLSMNTRGAAVAAWCVRRRDGSFAVVVNRFLATSWAGEEELATVPACSTKVNPYDTPYPRTADTDMAETGVPTVLYTDGALHVRRYESVAGGSPMWQPPETLWTAAGRQVLQLGVAVNQDGDALAAWYTENSPERVPHDVLAATYSAEFRTWGPVLTVAAEAHPRAANLGVGIDRNRRGMVVYEVEEGLIHAGRFDGASFLPTEVLATGGAYEFDFAMNRDGFGYLLSAHGNRDINLNVFSP